jgi:outer membrane protein assembly factor BamB
VATDGELIVPTGRAVPAVFWRNEGKFRYYHLQANGHVGGTLTVAAGQAFYNGGSAFNLADGALEGKLGAGVVARFGDGIVHGGKHELRGMKVVTKTVPDRKGRPVETRVHEVAWSVPDVDGSAAVIVAGDTIFAGGGTMVPTPKYTVTAVDAVSKKSIWKTDVDGTPYGLAAADGRLYVSTDRGTIYCYAAAPQQPKNVAPSRGKPNVSDQFAAAADEIIRRSGVTEGYCLDVDCGDGSLAIALAERTNLRIYALAPTADDVARARKRLSEAGLYGVRISVHQGDAANHHYGKYFADLIISARSVVSGPLAIEADRPPTALRPGGGIACTGRPGSMHLFTRSALAKAGSWTHQYSDLGNTSCSTDELVQGELRALWFRDVDLAMPQRHGRGHAPLFFEGRMFVEGMDALRAVDAYNGRNLWEFALPGIQSAFNADHLAGTAVTGSNLCVAASGVYVHDKLRCYRLDPASGKKLGQFGAPVDAAGKPGQWGYVACDGKLLFGTLANPDHKVRYAYVRADMSQMWGESKTFIALDAVSGELLWRYDAEHSIRNNAIAIGSGKVFLIDRPIADEDKWDPSDPARKLLPVKEVNQPPGVLLALDATTGKVEWKSEHDAFGTMLAYSQDHDTLLMGYQSTRFKLPSEVGGKLAVFRGASGERLWEKQARYVTRPLINDRRIYAQGGSWDLLTGEEQPFVFERSYGCGQLAGSRHMLLFRSATLGYLDLTRGSGVENFGGIRPGCWINALPVGGLVLVPDASAGCQCSYQNRSWMALTGDK